MPRAGRPGPGQAPAWWLPRHRGRPLVGRPAEPRAAAGDPGRHRRRRPAVRGARGGSPTRSHGELGHHRQRVGAGARPSGVIARSARGLASGRRGLAPRRRAVGRRLFPGLARALTRPHHRRAGRLAARRPAGCPRRGGRTVARRQPCPVVAVTTPGAGFMGLGAAHGPADLARAVVESVAWDVALPGSWRSVTVGRLGGSTAEGVTLGGAGSAVPVWVEVLTVRARPARAPPPLGRGRLGRRGAPGRRALGLWGSRSTSLDPVAAVIEPDAGRGRASAALRPRVDHVAAPVMALANLPESPSGRSDLPDRPSLPEARARRPGLRPSTGLTVEVPDRAEVVVPGGEPGLPDEAAPMRRGPAPHRGAGPAPSRPWSAGAIGCVVVFPDLTRPDAEPHRPPPAAGRARPAAGARPTASRSCAPTGTHRAGHGGRDGGARRAERRRSLRRSSTTTRQTRTHIAVGEVDGTPVLLTARVRGGRPAHHHRLRRAALLRRLQRRAEGGLPRTGRRLDHPGGAPAPRRIADARATFVVTGGQSGARLRAGGHRAGAARTCRSTSPSTVAPPDAVFAGPLPDGHDAACAHVQSRRCAWSMRRSTSWSRPTAATRSTATSTRR